MLAASWKNLMARKLRLVMSALAIILGVGFVSGSLIFTDALSKTFDGITRGTVSDVVVRPHGAGDGTSMGSATVPGSVIAQVAKAEGVARVDTTVFDYSTYVLDKNGKPIGGNGPPGMAFNYNTGPNSDGDQIVRITSGRAPEREGEVLVDEATARRAGLSVGKQARFVTARTANPNRTATVVGLMKFGSGGMAGATMVALDTRTAQKYYLGGKDVYSELAVTVEDGVSEEDVRAAVAEAAPGLDVVTGTKVAEQNKGDFDTMLRFINTFLLIFAAVALFVGTFLIINTFSILVAQRSRELALLRAIGAKRRQVTGSVLMEAVVVGLIGSTLGLLFGFLLAQGIKLLFGVIGLDISGARFTMGWRPVVASYVVGMLVTLVAAYLPARRAGHVPPVAAMREDAALKEGSLRGRVILGALLIVAGAVGMVLGSFVDVPQPMWWIGGGIFGLVLGCALTSPVVGRPFLAVMGRLYERLFGAVGRMAGENAVRNPRRTAATASALMIGLTLVSLMSVLGSSANASIDKQIKQTFAADYLVSNLVGEGFSPSITEQVRAVDGVQTVTAERYAYGLLNGTKVAFTGIDPKTFGTVQSMEMKTGSLEDLRTGTVLVPDSGKYPTKVGSRVTIKTAGTTFPVTVAGSFTETNSVNGVYFTYDTLSKHGLPSTDNRDYVVLEPGADAATVKADIEKVLAPLPTITLKDQADYADEQRGQINQVLGIIYALLGLAVIIAVLGIVNTLGLSVIERTREIGLLRAVGLTRRQLSRMIRLESIVIALLGAVLGLGLGVLCGVTLQRALVDDGIDVLSVPWVSLLVFVVLSALVGVLAAVWPARRGARLDVLQAITAT